MLLLLLLHRLCLAPARWTLLRLLAPVPRLPLQVLFLLRMRLCPASRSGFLPLTDGLLSLRQRGTMRVRRSPPPGSELGNRGILGAGVCRRWFSAQAKGSRAPGHQGKVGA